MIGGGLGLIHLAVTVAIGPVSVQGCVLGASGRQVRCALAQGINRGLLGEALGATTCGRVEGVLLAGLLPATGLRSCCFTVTLSL